MAVGNFTPDDIRWMFQGISGVLKPGDIESGRDRNWENHVLNKWGARGLVRLDFGDNQEAAMNESMRRYERFWERQIQIFNENNAQRKNEGKMYLKPNKELQEHAEAFGVKLIGPWTLERTEGSAGIQQVGPDKETTKRVDGLEEKIGKVESQVGEIHDMLAQLLQNKEEDTDSKSAKKK